MAGVGTDLKIFSLNTKYVRYQAESMKDKHGNAIPAGLAAIIKENEEPININDVVSLSCFDSNRNLKAIVETPKGSRHKYKYDLESGMYECHSTLPQGMVFPFDFGFIPSSKADDGDPLDILVLMDEPAFPGCLVRTRLLGVLQAEQKEGSGEIVRNDRLIGAHVKSIVFSEYGTWRDLPKSLRDQIEHFFRAYNEVKKKEFRPLGWRGVAHAYKLIEAALLEKRADDQRSD